MTARFRRLHRARAARGSIRPDTLVLGPAVLALFGWFALGACGFEEKSQPAIMPPPPAATMTSYDGFTVSETPTGTDFGGVSCDSQGKYRGGGDASTEDRIRGSMKGAVDKAKDELGDINRRLEQCKGKSRSDNEIEASFGCDRTKAGAARIRLENKQWELTKATKDYDENKNAIWTVPGETLKTKMGPNGWNVVVPDPQADREFEERQREREQYVKGLEQKIAQIKQEIPPLQADYQALQAKCDQAAAAKANDPCSPRNQDALKDQREALRVQAASHQYRLDKFNNCMDDRKRQAGGQPTGRTTVDPAILQVLPGVMGGFGGRSDGSRQSSPPPSHGHKD